MGEKCVEAPKPVSEHLRLGKQNFKKIAYNKKEKASKLDFSKEVHSKIPSQMRRQSKWVVTTGETLKAKKHTIVMTKQTSFPEEENLEEIEIFSSNHVSVNEVDAKSQEEDAEEASSSFEEGNQATIDELKEVNIGTDEDPRPIFVNACLSPEEEKTYLNLLKEYQDVFAWTYKEMPGLDPKVAVHHLAVKKKVFDPLNKLSVIFILT